MVNCNSSGQDDMAKGLHLLLSHTSGELHAFYFSTMLEECLKPSFLFLLCKKCYWPSQLLTFSVSPSPGHGGDGHISSALSLV